MVSFKPQLDTGFSTLKTIGLSFKEYPVRSVVLITLVCLAGLAESLGILLIIPLLNLSFMAKNPQEDFLKDAGSYQAQLFQFFESIHIQPTLPVLLGLLVILLTFKSALTLGANYYMGSVFASVARDMRIRLMRAVVHSSWSFLTLKPTGLYASAITQEIHRAASSYVSAWSLISALIQAVFFFIASATVSIEILGAGLAAGLLVLAALHFTVRMARRAGEQETQEMNDLISNLSDTMAGIKPLKAMGIEKRVLPYLEEKAQGLLEARKKLTLSVTLQQNLSEPLMVVVLAFGCYYAIEHMNMTIAHIAVIVIFFNRMMGRLSQMQKHHQNISNYASAYDFIKNLITQAESSSYKLQGETRQPSLERGIAFQNVGLSYEDNKVFGDLNIEIPAYKITTLIGPSGIGKTSIVDLITGLLHPQSGRILIDGQDLKTIDLERWHEMISYVPQELFLFHDTIKNNVTLQDQSYSDEDVWHALDQCRAADFVKALPLELETPIGEKGARLSGGQRQRIMIARALIRKPKLLILDEATTGLDPDTEKLVLEIIKGISSQTTVIAVSHQSAMKEIADQIIDVASLKST